MSAYLKNPDEIYALSFQMIDAEADLSLIPANARAVARRMIHACGMTDIAKSLVISPDFVPSAEVALLAGGKVLVDAEMVRHGIIAKLMPDRERIICTLNDPRTKEVAAEIGNTRSAAAVELWRPHLQGSVVEAFKLDDIRAQSPIVQPNSKKLGVDRDGFQLDRRSQMIFHHDTAAQHRTGQRMFSR